MGADPNRTNLGAAQFGFGAARRLRSHAQFVVAQKTGRRVGTPHFTLLVSAQQPPGGQSRLGIVASRAAVGGAVQRNRVKRLCRECFRTWPDLLPAGVDLVVIARAGASQLKLAQVREEWAAVEVRLKRLALEALERLAREAEAHHVGGQNR